MKKEEKNLDDQKEAFIKLWEGLKEASQTRLNADDLNIITDQSKK